MLSAGAARGQGVILLIGGRVFSDRHGPLLLAALLAVAERSDARACVQLDHCDDLAVIEAALDAGAGAVMADGSARPYAANVEFVRRAADLARARGAGVECELGGIAGDEDVAEAVAAGALTDPRQAVEFMAETGGDCLAVSIGNVHGVYRDPPDLDWARLEAIRTSTREPLSLHGASGISRGRAPASDPVGHRQGELQHRAAPGVPREHARDAVRGTRGCPRRSAARGPDRGGRARRRGEARRAPRGGPDVIRRLDHVAVAVADTDVALAYFRDHLGLAVVAVDFPPEVPVKLTYLDLGNTYLQLVEPLDPDHPLAAWLATNGEGLHHICFGVDDVNADLERIAPEDLPLLPIGSGRGPPRRGSWPARFRTGSGSSARRSGVRTTARTSPGFSARRAEERYRKLDSDVCHLCVFLAGLPIQRSRPEGVEGHCAQRFKQTTSR